ncbi:cellulose binding domain-containing protein [Actinomadura vinacea]|uniref:cellulose binding domain-containing protein n=1 Tax=Actinomadura vinacea TaxID=115336 RepID=UPI0031D616B3
MSAQEPGYVPPDHKSTTEFEIPKVTGAVQDETGPEPTDLAGDTVVDRPLPPAPADPEETGRDLRADDSTDSASTVVETPEPPSTVTDFTAEPEAVETDPEPEVPGTPIQLPVPPFARFGLDAEGPEPSPSAEEPAPAQTPSEPPPVVTAAAAEQGPWTEQFGAEEATGNAQAAPPAPDAPTGPTMPRRESGPAPAESPTSPAPPPAPLPALSPSVGLPPGTPVGPAAPAATAAAPAGKPRRPVLLAAVIAAMLVIGVGAIVTAIMASGSDDPDGRPAARSAPPATGPAPSSPPASGPSGAPSGPQSPGATAAPAPGADPGASEPAQAPGGAGGAVPPPPAAPAGPVVQGDGITYQLVQSDPGYYEGKFVFTNRSGRPMNDWTITFDAPGANVKNIWGARLTRGGDKVEIRNLENAPPVQPGATWEIQFGAEGTAANPRTCLVNGAPCGF